MNTTSKLVFLGIGARAYVAVGSENGVSVIDLETLEVASHIESGSGPDGLGWAVRN
jgi:YVTN family beta-propeller protein